MASRVTLYGNPAQPDVRRLRREMNVMYVEYDLADPRKDARAAAPPAAELVGETARAAPRRSPARRRQGQRLPDQPRRADPAPVPLLRRHPVRHLLLAVRRYNSWGAAR